VPYLAKRLTYATVNPKLAPREPHDLLGSLRHLYYETAMSANPYTVAALAVFIGTEAAFAYPMDLSWPGRACGSPAPGF
jgi:hypothetical protein